MYQHVLIENRAKLYQKQRQLYVEGEEIHHLPIEDLDTVVLANRGINVSSYCLEQLSANGTAVILCDGKFMPSAVLLPFGAHSRRLRQIKAQISQTKPHLKRLWQQIVR